MQRGVVGRRGESRGWNLGAVIVPILLQTQARQTEAGRRHAIDARPARRIQSQLRHVIAARRVVAVKQLTTIGRDAGVIGAEPGGGRPENIGQLEISTANMLTTLSRDDLYKM